MRNSSPLILLFFVLALSQAALASDMSDGNAAYKSGDYSTAVADYSKALAKATGVEQARAYYKLGLAYDKLGDRARAEQNYASAQTADPSLSFAKNPDAFRRKLARDAQAGSQPSGSQPTGSTPQTGVGDPAENALATGYVYVGPGVPYQIDQATLNEVAQEDERTNVKFAILDELPRGYIAGEKSRGYDSTVALENYADQLHKHLDMGRDGLELVCLHGYGAGVALVSDELTPSKESELAQKYAPRLQAGDMTQLAPLAREFVGAVNGAHSMQQAMIWIIVLIVVLIVAIVLIRRDQAKKAAMARQREPIDNLRQAVESSIEYIDGYMPVLPKNNADTDQIRAFRQAAAAKFEQAVKILDRASELTDLARAQSLLEMARQDTNQARRYLDRVTGIAGQSPGDAGVRPAMPAAPDPAAIPEHQRGVSFFSSQPAPVSDLVPVTINIDGVDRQVLATPSEAAQIRHGQIPPVRAFSVGGRQVPWYMYDGYDPYRDYWRYQDSGWGNVAAGAVAGFVGAELLDSLFNRPAYGGGWMSPYGYAPGWDNWGYWDGYDRGMFDADQLQAHNYAFSDNFSNPAGLGGFSGAGYDQSDYGGSDPGAGGAGFFGADNS